MHTATARDIFYYHYGMFKLARLSVLLVLAGLGYSAAHDLCPQFMLDSAMIVNVEGRFINAQNSRVSLDIEWRHHPEALDTFFLNFPQQNPIVFVTAGDSRYEILQPANVKRQLGLHHLRETIGNTPLKLDDLELLANGLFLCRDSTRSQKIFSTAFSNMWYSMVVDTLPQPQKVVMRGARKEARTFNVGAWKEFSGATLPTLVSMTGPNYSGNLWVRSAYTIEPPKGDPIVENSKRNQPRRPVLFRKTLVDGKREIPLILKLNQEFLRE